MKKYCFYGIERFLLLQNMNGTFFRQLYCNENILFAFAESFFILCLKIRSQKYLEVKISDSKMSENFSFFPLPLF